MKIPDMPNNAIKTVVNILKAAYNAESVFYYNGKVCFAFKELSTAYAVKGQLRLLGFETIGQPEYVNSTHLFVITIPLRAE